MAASKGLLKLIGNMIDGSWKVGSAGSVPDQAFRDLQRLNAAYLDPELLLFRHGVESRGWSKERTAETIAELLNSEKTMGVPNFAGGGRKAGEALAKPGDPLSIFAPVMPTRQGQAGLATLYEADPDRIIAELEGLKKLAMRRGAVLPPYPNRLSANHCP